MGSAASAPASTRALTTSEALAARVLRSKGLDGSSQFASTTALEQQRELNALPPFGDWWASPAAQAVELKLDEALSTLPQPCRCHLIDLLGFEMLQGVAAAAAVRARLAFSDRDAAETEVFDPVWHAPDEWTEEDHSCEPSAVVLQHAFPPLKKTRKDKSGFEITIRTLVFGALVHCPHAEYKRVAFGRLPVAIDPPGEQPIFNASPCTAIAINGEWLTPIALALLPEATRETVKAAQKAQMVHTMRACLQYRWSGGFSMLRKRVRPLLSVDAQIAVVTLATELVLARTGGEPTAQSRYCRAHHAELLQSQGRAAEAAEVERVAAEEALKLPPAHLTQEEPAPTVSKMRGCVRC
jgi:hypothetical protein